MQADRRRETAINNREVEGEGKALERVSPKIDEPHPKSAIRASRDPIAASTLYMGFAGLKRVTRTDVDPRMVTLPPSVRDALESPNLTKSPTSNMSDEQRIERGDKSRNFAGTATFIGLRALDPLLQYQILGNGLADGLVTTLGGSIIAQGPKLSPETGVAYIDKLGLSPYRLILLSMACGSSIKHIIWKAFIGEENMSPKFAGFVGVFNTVFNSLNSIFFITRALSPADGRGEGPYWPGWPGARLSVGSGLFVAGIVIELAAELQRKAFKSKKENEGMPHTSGLFALVKHPNYTGYTIWRTGYAIAAGGWVWGAFQAAFFGYDFATRAAPTLNEYCQQRYADLWHDYEKRTPYELVPGVV